ncbi:hypothetical protein WSS_A43510 [Rhodococcus opacus M213]|uniref:Uncharacterized protein n=1 Tax=Rhodococcus opacus M213 TaxID=1129896 RepID=K8X634_RHOOP|nr:hypothetical protein WSS_A43510 [Rhodococcus opacus M213]
MSDLEAEQFPAIRAWPLIHCVHRVNLYFLMPGVLHLQLAVERMFPSIAAIPRVTNGVITASIPT